MILKSLVKALTDDGVLGFVMKDLRMPLKKALESDVRPLERADLQMDQLSVPMNLRHDSVPWKSMRLDTMPKADFGLPGVLVGKNTGIALEYLVEHWVCGEHEAVDKSVTAAREARAAGAPFMHLVQRFAVVDGSSGRRHWDVEEDQTEAFIWSNEQFTNGFNKVHDSMPNAFTAENRGWGQDCMTAVVVPRCRVINGQKLQGWDVMSFGGDSDDMNVVVSSDSGWQAGPLRRIDPDIIAKFEQRGRLVSINEADLTVWQNWIAPVLVKVPKATGRIGDDADPECLANIPVGKLADARLPIAFTNDVRVIEDPVEALNILCRSSRGYVMSGIGGDVLPPSFKKLAGRWLALCVPVQWLDLAPCQMQPRSGVRAA
jgi:hypothetical protein